MSCNSSSSVATGTNANAAGDNSVKIATGQSADASGNNSFNAAHGAFANTGGHSSRNTVTNGFRQSPMHRLLAARTLLQETAQTPAATAQQNSLALGNFTNGARAVAIGSNTGEAT
jgi:hypothetical protein